jgi:pimeloyl-ACP methyl ester carboxylesterase
MEPRVKATIELAGTYALAENWPNRSPMSRATFQKRSGAHTDEEARERARAVDMSGLGARIKSPLLIVHGRRDPIAPFSGAERLAADCPNAEFAAFDDGNHGLTNRAFESRTLMSDWMAEKLRA